MCVQASAGAKAKDLQAVAAMALTAWPVREARPKSRRKAVPVS
jgi:hypothetical protein